MTLPKTKNLILLPLLLIGFFFLAGNSLAVTSSEQDSCFSKKGSWMSVNGNCPGTWDRSLCNQEDTYCCCIQPTTHQFISGEPEEINDDEIIYDNDPSDIPDDKTIYDNDPSDIPDEEDEYTPSSSQSSSASSGGGWTKGLDLAGEASDLPDTPVDYIVIGILKWLLGIFIVLAFISFVITGIMFLLAGTSKGMADKAKSAVSYSILALVVAFSAYIIISLVSSLLEGGSFF